MAKKRKDRVTPQELGTRLHNAYQSGYQDGYRQGVIDAAEDWVAAIPKVKGIGKVRGLNLQHQVMKDTIERINKSKEESSDEPTSTNHI